MVNFKFWKGLIRGNINRNVTASQRDSGHVMKTIIIRISLKSGIYWVGGKQQEF